MPFTLSHPAAVALLAPLARRAQLPLAALAIGAMVPDFEFFIHLRPLARWSHSVVGLITFCLPVGLLVLGAWELIVREPIRHLLGFPPNAHSELRGPSWWARASLALVLGAATHLLWDGFTHGGYWGVQLIPALRTTALTVGGRTVPWFNVLQHVSTVVGGLVVLGWVGREASRTGALGVFVRSGWRWLVILAIACTALAVGLWNGARWGAAEGYWGVQVWLGRVAVAALLGFALALLAYSVVHRLVGRAGRLPAT